MVITLELLSIMIAIFMIGISVGGTIKGWKLEKAYSPQVKEYMSQKKDMWKEFKKWMRYKR